MGIRQYGGGKPGSLGEVIPSRPTLRVPEREWRDWPYCFSRNMSDRYVKLTNQVCERALYEEMKSGQPPPEVLAAIGTGVDAAVECLRKNLGPEKAAAWWRTVRQAERDQSLRATFEAAEMRSKGIEFKDLATDPGFEEIGRKLAPDEFAVDTEIVLRPDQERQVGIHQWFPERSPYRIVLSRKDPHSGRYSLMIEHCHRARLSQHALAAAGDRFRLSLWFKHNSRKGAYKFTVDAGLKDCGYPTLVSIPVPAKPDQWQEIAADVAAPPNARLIILRLFINAQTADARCWVDDLFLGRYPK